MSELIFFDTYAFFEILGANPNYKKYADANGVTTIFNLAEFNYALKRKLSEELADTFTKEAEKFLIDVEPSDIKKAMSFRIKNKQFSVPDSIGYIIAQKYGMKFLTGDEDFKDLPNVEFVKK